MNRHIFAENPSSTYIYPVYGSCCTGEASDSAVTPALRTQDVMPAHPQTNERLTPTEVENDPKLNLQAMTFGTFYAQLRFVNQSRKLILEPPENSRLRVCTEREVEKSP